jgi:ADP-ribose pyrophosphatase YjhB (NUDIX family)
MACLGHGRYVVVVLQVGGSKASCIKLVLQREPRSNKTWFPACSILSNQELVDADVRELHEETRLVLITHGDLTLLSDAPVRVALLKGQRKLVYVFSGSIQVPCDSFTHT